MELFSYVCFLISDHVIFSGEFVFCHKLCINMTVERTTFERKKMSYGVILWSAIGEQNIQAGKVWSKLKKRSDN